MTIQDKSALQSAEFDALDTLIEQRRRLRMALPIDDDYKEIRFAYNEARRAFNDAQAANGHFKPLARSIIQPWAAQLGLRHQGVLVSAVRGCDSIHREDASKYIVRVYRGALLIPHCADLTKSASFMIPYDGKVWDLAKVDFLSSIDHYPNHWLLHFAHAAEITGYKHSDPQIRVAFSQLYYKIVRKFHMHVELVTELDARLNADETSFKNNQE